MKPQKTIAEETGLAGKGMFGGVEAKVLFRPGPADTGIVFVRTDLDVPVKIPAVITNVTERARRTALQKGSASVETIEHCMAAINALEIDNLIIEVQGPEMPGFDGGSGEYFKALKKVGFTEQASAKKEFVISEEISISEGGSYIYALPYDGDGLQITYEMDYTKHTGVGKQLFSCELTTDYFEQNLAPARTFLLEAEAKQFQASGIGTHLSPKEILVISSDGPIKNSFRFPDECVRHKIVDLIGDLGLAGRRIKGRIVAYKSGHRLNQKLAAKIFEQAGNADRVAKVGTDAILDIRRIQKILPHRYPFLLVDKVIEINGVKSIKGVKNVTYNELFFQGHFPGTPIMPGVLILEAMAQVSGLLFAQTLENTGRLAVLLGMDSVKLRKAVVPGDQLILIAETIRAKNRTAICRCRAMVGSVKAAEADIKFMLVDDDVV
ncbi:MAG: UDP-3-O-acyl-N-acetylglucosamine deacetylase [Anaerohalosphaeraceae bacterium]|nr:UDP-3-O-acyl-N-acetylglucosamine deacetylase [Anaerohalosphaeraceae bacterium]